MSRRLVAGLTAAVAGSAIAIGGTRATWYTITTASRSVSVPGLGETVIPKVPERLTGSDIASWTTPLAVLMLLAALLCLLVGPRARTPALVLVLLGAPALVVAWVALGPAVVLERTPVEAGRAVTADIQPGIGTLLTAAGAMVAAVGAVWAWPARRAQRIGMPEVTTEPSPGTSEPDA